MENGVLELEVLDNTAGSEVEILPDNFHKFLRGFGSSSIIKNSDRKWFCNSNSVRNLNNINLLKIILRSPENSHLYETPLAKSSLDK